MGAGFKTFTAGSILTASDVQNYLQDQAVMVFGGTAARSSAIGTANFEEGMLTYLTDVDKLQVYTGASFVDVYPAAATNQGLTLINTTSFSAGVSSQSLPTNTMTATYDSYRVIIDFGGATLTNNCDVTFRLRAAGSDASGGNYNYQGWSSTTSLTNSSNSSTTEQFIGKVLAATSERYSTIIDFTNFTVAKETKYFISNVGMNGDTNQSYAFNGWHGVATAYDSMTFFVTSGTISGGRIRVYGYNQ